MVASRDAGGRCASRRSRGLAGREAGRVPADQRLDRRVGRVADATTAAAGADQRRRRWPSAAAPPPRRAGGPGRAPARCRAARRRRSRPRPPARRPGWPRRSPARRRPRPAPGRRPTCGPRCRGNARPSSSAVRVSPTTGARRPRWPHSGQAQASSAVPHHRQAGGAVAAPSASGPVQTRQRAGVRQRSQARAAAYPLRGVCTSTGPVASASRIAWCTSVGIRAARASGSRPARARRRRRPRR